MLNQWKIGPKVYLVVGLLALVAAAIGGLGVDAMHTYNEKVRLIDRASNREILGERVNGRAACGRWSGRASKQAG